MLPVSVVHFFSLLSIVFFSTLLLMDTWAVYNFFFFFDIMNKATMNILIQKKKECVDRHFSLSLLLNIAERWS